MAEVKTKPKGLPSGNDLDNLEINPDTGLSIDAYLSFGTTPKALPNPPKKGDVVTYLVKVECIGKTEKDRTDGETRYTRHLNIISAWKPGDKEPVTDQDQGELFDNEGNPTEDTDAEDADE